VQKKWTIKKADQQLVEELKASLTIDQKLCTILVNRGISTFEQAKDFFRHNLTKMHDPFLMKGMQTAVDRLVTAISNKEKILVFGDYDVDGTTAVSLVYSFLRTVYDEELLEYYIPDRYNEGYGVSIAGIDYAKANGFALIIALDCGVKAVEKVDYANTLDVDFIICDHHLPGDTIPKAIAVLDPKQTDCPYPYKELTGCGIGFKFMYAYSMQTETDLNISLQYLDLLSVSIASDIVPITGENRLLTHFGVKKLTENPTIGLAALKGVSGITTSANIYKIVFGIGPRINAAGRIKHGKFAVQLLSELDLARAEEMASVINENNTDRKVLDKASTLEAIETIDNSIELQQKKSTVLYNPNWHKGIIGIVASRVMEKYYRPTIILTKSNDKVAGSARSVKGFNVHHAIEQCSDVIEQFGGHFYAAGLTLKPENVPAFQAKFEEVVSKSIEDYMLIPEIVIDCEIDFDDINDSFWKILRQMAPFGPQNMRPQFVSKSVYVKNHARVVGDSHLQLTLHQAGNDKSFKGIAFNQGDKLAQVKSGKQFDVVYNVKENEWQGNVTLQLDIKDIRFE